MQLKKYILNILCRKRSFSNSVCTNFKVLNSISGEKWYFCNMDDNDAEFPGKSESAPGLNYIGNSVSLLKPL